MAVASACFKWADVLENQFDKSWVELDTILCQLEDDEVGKLGLSSLPSILTFCRALGCPTCSNHHHHCHHHHHYYVQDFGMLHLQGRRAASSLASCFSQFAHKSTTVFQVVLSFALSFVFLKYSPGLNSLKQTGSLLFLLIAC